MLPTCTRLRTGLVCALVLTALPSCTRATTREFRPWWDLWQRRAEATVTTTCRVDEVGQIHRTVSPWTCHVVRQGTTRTESVADKDDLGHVGDSL